MYYSYAIIECMIRTTDLRKLIHEHNGNMCDVYESLIDDYDWIDSMKKEYEQICSTLEVLEDIQKEARKYEKAGKKV